MPKDILDAPQPTAPKIRQPLVQMLDGGLLTYAVLTVVYCSIIHKVI